MVAKHAHVNFHSLIIIANVLVDVLKNALTLFQVAGWVLV